MRRRFPAPASLALGTAALLLHGALVAFTTTGDELDLSQRDVRVFNNFSHPNTNDNTSEHPSFPGYTGAPLALWKAAIEWGSFLHGDGQGDPHQPGDLGSGGANYDPTWQGLAAGTGGTNDNVVSELSGCSPGLLGFLEVPSSDGWRMRFCAGINLDDDPGTGTSAIDLQGVAAHQFGHALGLGHSSVNGATMQGAPLGNGVSSRSIEADDQAGVQSIYGVASATKPRITSVSLQADNRLVLSGQNLSTPAQVWFTQAGIGGDGEPVALDATSQGADLWVQVPPGAGSGDVLVRLPGAAFERLSNAFPLALPGLLGQSECSAFPGASGSPALLTARGSAVASSNDFTLVVEGPTPGISGLFFFGNDASSVPFGNGVRCVTGQVKRLPGVVQVRAGGVVGRRVDLAAPPAAGRLVPGATVRFQFWYRDPVGQGFNLSDALRVDFL